MTEQDLGDELLPPPRWYASTRPPSPAAPGNGVTIDPQRGELVEADDLSRVAGPSDPAARPQGEAGIGDVDDQSGSGYLTGQAGEHVRGGAAGHAAGSFDAGFEEQEQDFLNPSARRDRDPSRTSSGEELPWLSSDASAADVARAARAAFAGRDLVAPSPVGWPFGERARARRERAEAVREEARRRRAGFQQAFQSSFSPAPAPATWRPVERRRNVAVVLALAAVAGVVFAVSMLAGGGSQSPAPGGPAGNALPASTEPVAPETATPTSAAPPGSTAPPGALTPRAPIPPTGVAAIAPPPATVVAPDSVAIAATPAGEPTAAELSTPEAAMAAFLGRSCPYTYQEAFGTAEQRARSSMTTTGWAQMDPSRSDRARQSWAQIVAAQQSARCGAPTTVVSPEAPRSDRSAIVLGQIQRVITAGDGARWVDTLTSTRIVLRGTDGRWRVDTVTTGG